MSSSFFNNGFGAFQDNGHPHTVRYQNGFRPLFQLLDDFDAHTHTGRPIPASLLGGRDRRQHAILSTFHPRFDVCENDIGFELHGELPGLEKKDISIEFTDARTMVVCGRVERAYTSGTPPTGAAEGAKTASAIADVEHQATVEDEDKAKKAEEKGIEVAEAKPADTAVYWVNERSVGEFSRSFVFPAHVDQDGVTANLKNGILTVEVPKAKKHESRRHINVD